MILEGENIVINTGGRPVIPNIKGIENNKSIFLSEDIMNLEKLPKTLTIIGGGYIGLEFATIYSSFGSDVTIIQNEEEFLPREDEDIVNAIRKTLEEKGIKIITGAKITEIENSTVIYSIGEEERKLESDIILLATGRRPNTDNLRVENAGIVLNERGGIKTDDHLRTDAENIWAAGDVCGKLQFTYISLDDSRIILDDMNGNRVRTINNRGAFSYSVFIQPTFSRVGMNEKEAMMNNVKYRVVKLPVMAIPKAKVLRKTEGMLKALIKEDGTILGAELFCEESHEMINFIKLAIDNNIKADVIKNFIFTHPTMSESLNDLFSL